MDLLFIPGLWRPFETERANQDYEGGAPSRLYAVTSLIQRQRLIAIIVTGEPQGVPLWRADSGYGPGAEGTNRINATLLSLVRNEEIDGMVH